ncbi:unnamed protein product [marine sediment metagenome]|uniref:Uncharacterized protein n=1 Tax=marine sediment metagenome TaxID=412755 RepID=X0XPR0_9ZZZZ
MVKKFFIFLGIIIILGAVGIGYNVYRTQEKVAPSSSQEIDENFTESTPLPTIETPATDTLLEEGYQQAIFRTE